METNMTTLATTAEPITGRTALDTLETRLRIAALWTAMLFVFAYVDIFALFRADIAEGVMAHTVAGLTIDQGFLLASTVYVIIPSVMIYLSLVLAWLVNRWVNLVLAGLYILSIGISCIGETWAYYLVGSAAEIGLLIVLAVTAWRWRAE
jgi:hypothetical protein